MQGNGCNLSGAKDSGVGSSAERNPCFQGSNTQGARPLHLSHSPASPLAPMGGTGAEVPNDFLALRSSTAESGGAEGTEVRMKVMSSVEWGREGSGSPLPIGTTRRCCCQEAAEVGGSSWKRSPFVMIVQGDQQTKEPAVHVNSDSSLRYNLA